MQHCALVRGDYQLEAQLVSYASATHRRYNGFCCSGMQFLNNGSCSGNCANRFLFCLRPTGFGQESDACPTGKSLVTGVVDGGDRILFEPGKDLDDGVPNPLVFSGKTWPVSSHVCLCLSVYTRKGCQNLLARLIEPSANTYKHEAKSTLFFL